MTRDLYERYSRQIYTYCLHQLRNKEEAEDATQSTFLNAFRGLQRGIDPEFESAWLYKIAQNVCLTRQRSSTRRRRVESPGDLDAMQDFVPAHEVDRDDLVRLPEALEEMPEQQRRALLLREWQGLSYKEIAEELDLSQAAVETLLFRARRTLAAGLTDEQPAKKSVAKRLRAGGDLGTLAAIAKSIFLTGGAKVAATVATVAATSVVAATPAARHAVEGVVAAPDTHRTPVAHVAAKPKAHVSRTRTLVAPTIAKKRSAPVHVAAHRRAVHAPVVTAPVVHLVESHAPRAVEPAAAPPVVTPVETPAPVTEPAPAPTPDLPPAAETPKSEPAPTVTPTPTPTSAPAAEPKKNELKKDEKKSEQPQAPQQQPAQPASTREKKADDEHGKKDKRRDVASVQVTPSPLVAVDPAQAPTTTTTTTTPALPALPPGQAKKDDHGNNKKDAPVVVSDPQPTTPAPVTTAPAVTVTAPPTTTTDAVPAPVDPAAATPDKSKGRGQGHRK